MSAAYGQASAQAPSLKHSCDSGVQLAFSDGQWSTVINLTRQRFKTTKDAYYQVVELAARSRLDTVDDKYAAQAAVEKIIKEKVVVKDASAVDLYDWACNGATWHWPSHIGVLRAVVVKANPADKETSRAAFDACVARNDWEHAQQIAASMDKNFPSERGHGVRNIVSTYILATRLAREDVKRTMFFTLAKRMVEKAKELRVSKKAAQLPERALASEEDMLLWLEMEMHCNTVADALKIFRQAGNGPLDALEDGHPAVFRGIMGFLESNEAWDDVFSASQAVFEKGLSMHSGENLSSGHDADTTSAFYAAVLDWTLWKQFIRSAAYGKSPEKDLPKAKRALEEVSEKGKLLSLHKRQLDLARISLAFEMRRVTRDQGALESDDTKQCIQLLQQYVSTHYRRVSCFDDMRRSLELLEFDHANQLIQGLKKEAEDSTDEPLKRLMFSVICLKARYLVSMSPKSLFASGEAYRACLESIATECARLYRDGTGSHAKEFRDNVLSAEDVDPHADLAIIGATCLLKLAGLSPNFEPAKASCLQGTDIKHLLQAVIWLDFHYQQNPRGSSSLRVMLSKIYILLGCVTRAEMIWDSLEVKNVTLDSLGPVFSDRLSTIIPGRLESLLEYRSFYSKAQTRSLPDNIKNASSTGNYSSILGLLDMASRLQQSCTLVMTVAEGARSRRYEGDWANSSILGDKLIGDVEPAAEFVNAMDVRCLPDYEHPTRPPLYDLISIGPRPSGSRARLSITAEQFISLITFVPPKDFKSSKSNIEAERRYMAEVCGATIAPTLEDVLDNMDHETTLTGPERHYYHLIQQLVALMETYLQAPTSKPIPRPKLTDLATKTVEALIDEQISALTMVDASSVTDSNMLTDMTSLHAMGTLLDSALVLKALVSSLTTSSDKLRAIDKSAQPQKWLLDDLDRLSKAGQKARQTVQSRVQRLKEVVSQSGWMDRFALWAFPELSDGTKTLSRDEDEEDDNNNNGAGSADRDSMLYRAIGQQGGVEHWTGVVLDSWQDLARQWQRAKLD